VREALASLTKESVIVRAREPARALVNYGGTRAAADAELDLVAPLQPSGFRRSADVGIHIVESTPNDEA
jgi:hypothetical protein